MQKLRKLNPNNVENQQNNKQIKSKPVELEIPKQKKKFNFESELFTNIDD